MTQITSAINITGKIAPFDTEDIYATHDSIYGKGGYRELANEAARLAIPTARRTEGMLVYQQDTGLTYKLAADLTTWELKVDVDLTGYATEAYVDTAVAAATGADLSNYYTKPEADESAISYAIALG